MHLLKLLIVTVILVGCTTDLKKETESWPPEKLYTEAKEALELDDYETAIKYYELLEAHYPFDKLTQPAQLEMIYAYYKFEEPESALVAADQFLKLYPRHPNVDYVYYLKGLINFELTQGIFERFLPIDRSQRDPNSARRSFQEFTELVTRFPQSQYTAEARQRMLYLRNILAQYELNVAKFYMIRGAYLAAANRAKTVIESYQRSPAMPEALTILAKAYKIMGLNDLSNDALTVLKLNYPDYKGILEVVKVTIQE